MKILWENKIHIDCSWTKLNVFAMHVWIQQKIDILPKFEIDILPKFESVGVLITPSGAYYGLTFHGSFAVPDKDKMVCALISSLQLDLPLYVSVTNIERWK